MRGFHDELGGPESIAGSEWGPLSFGDDVTAAGLPASPGSVRNHTPYVKLASPSDVWSEDRLRHNFLKRREMSDPGYGASRGFDWREKALVALGVPYVPRRYPSLPLSPPSGSRKPPFGG